MRQIPKGGWSKAPVTWEDFGGIVSRRFVIALPLAVKALKMLDAKPLTAFCKLAEMSNDKALDHIFSCLEIDVFNEGLDK